MAKKSKLKVPEHTTLNDLHRATVKRGMVGEVFEIPRRLEFKRRLAVVKLSWKALSKEKRREQYDRALEWLETNG